MVNFVQKIKFKGNRGQIFSIGNELFPSGIWKIAKPNQIAIIVEADITNMFEFNPPLPDITLSNEEEKPVEEEKPKRRRRKKKTEEIDE